MPPKLSAGLRLASVIFVVTVSVLDMLPHGVTAVRDYLAAADTTTPEE